jgi:hypothetical protein
MRLLDRWQAYTKFDRAIIELRSALGVESRTSPQRQGDGRYLKAHRLAGSQTAGVHEREAGPVNRVCGQGEQLADLGIGNRMGRNHSALK